MLSERKPFFILCVLSIDIDFTARCTDLILIVRPACAKTSATRCGTFAEWIKIPRMLWR